MYRIMIVDDEKYIRLSIRNRIDWACYGLEVVGEAADGEEAYAAAQLYQPDIMLVDIRMPVLDGLGLIRLLRESDSYIRVIILSAYQDFDYAKKAIQLGVEDYLLKPIDEAELDRTLNRIISELNHAEKKKLFPVLDMGRWNQAGFTGADYCCAVFYIPGVWEESLIKLAAGVLYEGIRKAGFKSLKGLALCVVKGLTEDGILKFVLNCDGLNENYLYYFFSQITGLYAAEYNGMKCGISAVFQDGERMEERMEEAVQLLKYKMIALNMDVFDRRVIPKEESGIFLETRKLLSVLYGLSAREEYGKLKELSSRFIDQNLVRMKKIREMEYVTDEYLVVLRSIAQKKGNPYDTGILFHDFLRQNYILDYDHVNTLQKALKGIAAAVLSLSAEADSRDITKQIKEYIQDHFMENMTTRTISERFHLNSTYLSTLFKEKNGITLMSYIEGVRMEHAAELLKNESFTVADAAVAVGYTDTNYFGKVFKKYSGMTPGQYKSRK